MANVIVTGGTGFLGRNMIRRLCCEGHTVFAVVRPDSMNKELLPDNKNVVPVFCELGEIKRSAILEGKPFEAFYHFAWGGVNRAQIDDDAVQQRSKEASIKAVEAGIELNCKSFIFAGSRSEYGQLKGPFSENAECHPLVAYGRAKLEFGNLARELCRDTDMRFIHGRIFSVYGVDDHPWSLIHTAVTKMLKNEPMDLSSCRQLWNFMDVRDMADLLLTFQNEGEKIQEDDNGIFNIATDDIRPLKSFIEEIYHITDSKSELHFGAYKQSEESALSIIPDMSKVESTFGWKQRIHFSDGIRYIVEQMEANDA